MSEFKIGHVSFSSQEFGRTKRLLEAIEHDLDIRRGSGEIGTQRNLQAVMVRPDGLVAIWDVRRCEGEPVVLHDGREIRLRARQVAGEITASLTHPKIGPGSVVRARLLREEGVLVVQVGFEQAAKPAPRRVEVVVTG